MHVTLRVRRGTPRLRTKRFVRTFRHSLAEASERGDFRVVHFAILSNHAHFLLEANDRGALGRGMKSLCARFARAVNRVFERRGRVLGDRYHMRVLHTPREVRDALAYVLLNARKHATERGIDVRWHVDPASSASFFDGWNDPGPDTAPGTPPRCVSPAKSWLLHMGWRKHGLIDPAEIPSATRLLALRGSTRLPS
jgi:REP element-mobilizing transposase RayT